MDKMTLTKLKVELEALYGYATRWAKSPITDERQKGINRLYANKLRAILDNASDEHPLHVGDLPDGSELRTVEKSEKYYPAMLCPFCGEPGRLTTTDMKTLCPSCGAQEWREHGVWLSPPKPVEPPLDEFEKWATEYAEQDSFNTLQRVGVRKALAKYRELKVEPTK